jgi:hypothetical protein
MYVQVPTYLVCTNTYIPTLYVRTYMYLPALYVQVPTYLIQIIATYLPHTYVCMYIHTYIRTYIYVPTYLVRTYTYLTLISWKKHRVLRKWAMTERINQKIY